MPVRLVITTYAKPGKGAELALAMADRCRAVQQEPGCQQFEVFQSALDPDKLVVLELWDDQAALVLVPCAFAVEQAFSEKLFGDVPAAAFLKGAVLPDEHLMQVLGMAEEHCAFWAESEGNDIAVFLLEATHKAQHIAGKGPQMGPGNAGPGARRQRCGNHTPSFCGGVAPRMRGRHHSVRDQAVRATGEGNGWPASGVTTTLSHCSSAGRRGGTLGSPSRTSRPAPARRCARSASSRAWVSTTVPRPR